MALTIPHGLQIADTFLQNQWVYPSFHVERGYHIVSTSYRLIPHASLDDILADLRDCLTWCRQNLPRLVGETNVDLDRYVVAGDSAGGTLSLFCGLMFEPKPRAVLDLYGIVDFADPFFHVKPKLPLDCVPPGWHLPSTTEDKLVVLSKQRDLREAKTFCPWHWELEPSLPLASLRSYWGTPELQPDDSDKLRMDLRKYQTEQGRLMMWMLFHGETCADEAEFIDRCHQYNILRRIRSAADLPPTYIIHGTADIEVPHSQSVALDQHLTGLGHPHVAVWIEGGAHAFDNQITVSLLVIDKCRVDALQSPNPPDHMRYITPFLQWLDGIMNEH